MANTALEISPELKNLLAGDSVELGLSHGVTKCTTEQRYRSELGSTYLRD